MNLENTRAAQYFCENQDTVFFQDTLVNLKFKRTAFIWNIFFCSIIDTVTTIKLIPPCEIKK